MIGVGFVYGFVAGSTIALIAARGWSTFTWLVWLLTLEEDESFTLFNDTEKP